MLPKIVAQSLVVLSGALGMSSCTEHLESRARDRVEKYNVAKNADLTRYDLSVFEAAGLRKRYSGATTLDYSEQHGTQVEYMAADGRAYLWYPGNSRVVVGQWKTQTARNGAGEICFRFGTNTYNPVTKTRGGYWNCRNGRGFIFLEEEYTTGDPFNLESGRIPYVMPKSRKMTFKSLARPLKISITPYL